MNLTDRYPISRNKQYTFAAVENPANKKYNVVINKWSEIQNKHIFLDQLSCQSYLDILGEPDMLFDSLFEGSEQERDLLAVLRKAQINFKTDRDMETSIDFLNVTEAEKCVKLLYQKFKYVTP
jgi:hypothetical protein